MGDAYTNGTYQTNDGTHITYVGSAAYGGVLYFNDGTKVNIGVFNNRLLPNQIENSNGNYVAVSYKYGAALPLAIDFVTDTQGRKIQFNYDGSGDLISITAPGYGGTAQNPVTRTVAQFDYQSRTISYNFAGLTIENVPTGSVNVLRHIYFPGTSTGWLYSYSDYGMVYSVSSRRQMTIDGNGVINDGVESANVSFNYPISGSTSLSDAPAFTQRTESASGSTTATYNYSSAEDTIAMTKSFAVTRPDGSLFWVLRDTNPSHLTNGLLLSSGIYNMIGSVFTYANDPGGSVQVQSVIDINSAGQQTKIDVDYDQYGNVTNKREYGFPIGGSWQIRRRTNLSYLTDPNYTSRYLRSLVTETKILDPLENVIAKTAFIYDNYAATGGMEGYGTKKPPSWDSSYTTSFVYRGNITGITQWTDMGAGIALPTKLRKYDKFGNVLQEQVSCCKQKVFSYVENDYWANPPTVTNGDPQGLNLAGVTTYDFNTGLPKYTEFAHMGKRWFFYDAAMRLVQQDLPTGGSQTASYNDVNMTASFSKTGLGTSTLAYDGFGRTTQAVDADNGQVNISYDVMGRVATRTNPFAAGGTPGPSSSYTYDALGRITIVTLPDSQIVQHTYAGAVSTVTDQVNRKIRREIDGLGRLVKVTEQDASGTLTQETIYDYNLLDKLTSVNQGNQARSFKYDALGRLLYERIPEQTESINDGTGTLWTTKYTYTDFNGVATKTDARGVLFTYSYDNLNRLTSILPNTTNAPGVAPGGGSGFTYDNNDSSPTKGLLLSAGNESYSYDNYRRVTSITRTIDSTNYITNYQYGAGSLRSRITYPSGRVVNINRSSSGRLTSLTNQSFENYLSGIGYNAAGQVTASTLGNGVVETYGYDANRLLLTTQTATKSGGPTNGLMNLTYNFQATAGQMGAGSTAGNAGQLMSISGTINGTSESAAYTYDNVGRLVTSNQISNGSSAQRRFEYDRWGNRTAVWDAVSGGTKIQGVNIRLSGTAPTNQIQTVGTVSYYYDAAGNVTDDGSHTYTYDANNRVVNVDNGSTAQNVYDQNNRRIKKTVGSAVTHYVWEGSQVVAEYDGSTGALITEFIYSNDRMISKISNGNTQYFLSDELSTRLVLDASGNLSGRQGHLPFGETLGESGTQEKHHFTSYDRDAESGADYAPNRTYVPNVGRFQQADPYRTSGYRVDPQSWNRYAYVGNDPVNSDDPTGLIKRRKRGYIPEIDGPSTSGEPPAVDRAGFDPSIVILDDLNDSETEELGTPFDFANFQKELQRQLADALRALIKTKCVDDLGGATTLNRLADEVERGEIKIVPIVQGNPDAFLTIPDGKPLTDGGLVPTYWEFWQARKKQQPDIRGAVVTFDLQGDYQSYNTIVIGVEFFDDKGWGRNVGEGQNITLVHEYLHILNNMNDGPLADQLKLSAKGYNTSIPGGAISKYLADCFKNPK